MNNKYKQVEKLSSNLKRDKINLDQLKDEIAENSLKDDPKIYDDINKLNDAYSIADFTKVKSLSKSIHHACAADRSYDFNSNPVRIIRDYENKPKGHVFPNRFHLGMNIQRGNAIVCGSPPGAGKTTFALNMILYYAKERKRNIAYFTWEMSPAQLWIKLFTIDQMVSHNNDLPFMYVGTILQMKKENRNEEHTKIYNDLYRFVTELTNKIHIYKCGSKPLSFAMSILERLHSKIDGYPDWIILDYIQRIRPEKSVESATRKDQLEHASWSLTNHCETNELNWLVLSQLNKEGGYKETGALNEDAGMSIVLNRDKDSDNKYIESIEIKITKSRFSEIGSVKVPFYGKSGTIGRL